jgi:hypothetical protein
MFLSDRRTSNAFAADDTHLGPILIRKEGYKVNKPRDDLGRVVKDKVGLFVCGTGIYVQTNDEQGPRMCLT